MDIKLIAANLEDLNTILQMQKEAFSELYAKYQDTETSPSTEEYEDILFRINQTETTYYFITADNVKVGVIGYAQQAIKEAERIHGKQNWKLDTILQEKGNCYLYEKLGYHQTGKTEQINDKMTIVFYEKD